MGAFFLLLVIIIFCALFSVVCDSIIKARHAGDPAFQVSGDGKDVSYWGTVLAFLYILPVAIYVAYVYILAPEHFQQDQDDLERDLEIIVTTGSSYLLIVAIAASIGFGLQKRKMKGDKIVLALLWIFWLLISAMAGFPGVSGIFSRILGKVLPRKVSNTDYNATLFGSRRRRRRT